jgi:hypothetical protein
MADLNSDLKSLDLKIKEPIKRVTLKNDTVWFHHGNSICLSYKLVYSTLCTLVSQFSYDSNRVESMLEQLYHHVTKIHPSFQIDHVNFFREGSNLMILFEIKSQKQKYSLK